MLTSFNSRAPVWAKFYGAFHSNSPAVGIDPAISLGNSGVETVRGLYPNIFFQNQSFERKLFLLPKIFST
ncbi:MAG: hypothetical protein A3J76_00635 [Candidatus Moranbacteria bacterium RBG_13_45_13]|nr:MAG: hypothetical protein A3J76_00635 [Candidatus Moranbacteria bacterium RBG_13_45_13]